MIDVEIVEENFPLLLSKSSLEKAGNIQLDKAFMFISKIMCMDKKTHEQVGHASAENLKRLFQNAGKLNSEITSF